MTPALLLYLVVWNMALNVAVVVLLIWYLTAADPSMWMPKRIRRAMLVLHGAP
jgi:hypothetical protein